MLKKIIAAAAAAFTAAVVSVSACAFADVKIIDNAEVLTPAEETALLEKIDAISVKYGVDTVIYTTKSLGKVGASTYEKKVFEESGCGTGENKDGIVLLLVADTAGSEGSCYFGTHGWARTDGITIYGQDRITELIEKDVADRNFAKACDDWLTLSGKFLKKAQKGKPYSEHNVYRTGADIAGILVLWTVIGAVAAVVVCLLAARTMKKRADVPIKTASAAKDTFKLGLERNVTLYTKTVKVLRAQAHKANKKAEAAEKDDNKKTEIKDEK